MNEQEERGLALYKEANELKITVLAMVSSQRRLSWLKKRELLQSQKALTQDSVTLADLVVKTLNIPYHTIAMIPDRKGNVRPYVTAEGWWLRARMDERGISDMQIQSEINESAESCRVTCTITLGSGQRFQGVVYKRLRDETNTNSTLSTLHSKCVTQARGKAASAAIGTPFPGIAEEYSEVFETKATATDISAAASNSNGSNSVPKNSARLVAQASAQFKMNITKVLQVLGVESLAQITDMAEAWDKVQEAAKGMKEANNE